ARTHPPHKVSIRGRDALLVVAQDAHVAADAGAAGGGRDNAIGVHEHFHETFLHHLPLHFLAPGDDDAPNPWVNFSSTQHVRSLAHILDPAVGTGPDNHLVNLHVAG